MSGGGGVRRRRAAALGGGGGVRRRHALVRGAGIAQRRTRTGASPASRAVRIVLSAVAVVGGAATPALADAAGPTNFRSVVTDAPGQGVDAQIVGGDAFLELRVPSGTDVVVPGYEPEELYLRIGPDGVVEVNTRSEAFYLNEARYGARDVAVPEEVGPDVPPEWRRVADGGVYAWHDHRIHWMSPTLPPAVDPDASQQQLVQNWTVPLEVGGESAQVAGRLVWVPGAAPVTGFAVAVVAAAGVLALARLRSRRTALALGAAGAVASMLAVGADQNLGLPPGAVGETALVVLPAVGILVLVVAWARRRTPAGAWLAAGAVVPATVAAGLQVGALTRPVVPGSLPTGVTRALVAVALGAALAVILVGARLALDELRVHLDDEPDARGA